MAFWKNSLKSEYDRWWKPTGNIRPNLVEESFKWPEHISYPYPNFVTPNLYVTPVANAPDPPSDPYIKKSKNKKRSSQMFTSKQKVPDNHILCSRKILLRPTIEQKKILRTWFASARHTYNWALGVLKRNNIKDFQSTNRMSIKTKFVTCKETRIPKKLRWIKKIPYTVNESSTAKLAKSFSDRRDDSKDSNLPFRFPKFLAKGKTETTITIDKQNFSKKEDEKWRFYVSIFPYKDENGNDYKHWMRKKDRDWIKTFPDGPIRQIQLSLTPTGSFYMIVPFYKKIMDIEESMKGHLVATDPGSNPFMTYYSPTKGKTGSYGTETNVQRFRKQQKQIDKIRSNVDLLKNELKTSKNRVKMRKLKKLLRKGRNIHRKSRDLAKDAIQKVVNKLTSEYQYIHIPPFQVQSMVKKTKEVNGVLKKRRIAKQTVRDIYGWLHYPFRKTLLHKQSHIRGLKVEILSEYLTTKSCDNCGELNENIGGMKHFTCEFCTHNVNRDVHGARNNCLRNCVERYTLAERK